MKRWYALDYIGHDECELVCNDQLYLTEEEAVAARKATGREGNFDISWYGIHDLEEIYNGDVEIDESTLKVHPAPMNF